jgi:hypothetical protein
MATWLPDKQRWSFPRGSSGPLRYCFPPRREGSEHPARNWTDQEKEVARHAINEWNEALREYAESKGRPERDWIVEGPEDGPNDVTLRWENDSFFRDWTEIDETEDPPRREGINLETTAAYADRIGGGSLERTDNPQTPFTPGRNTTDFPRMEVYFNVTAPDPPTRTIDGWFVDPTPDEDEEFELRPLDNGHEVLKAKEGGPAENKMDLYTVVKHEIGHMMGLDHQGSWDDANDRGQLMRDGVGGDERRHDIPSMNWMVEERRHLQPDDLERMEALYREELERSGRNAKWLLFLLALILFVLLLIFFLT